MYVWRKYWSRKTWNLVGEHIQAYTKPHQVVFDPFAGSGVVAIAICLGAAMTPLGCFCIVVSAVNPPY